MIGPKNHKINYEYCKNTKTTTKCASTTLKLVLIILLIIPINKHNILLIDKKKEIYCNLNPTCFAVCRSK